MRIQACRLLIIAWTSGLLLTGCASGVSSPSTGAPSVKQVYAAAMQGRSYFEVEIALESQHFQLPTITREANVIANTLDAQFPTVKNPQSVMYIFGHYAGAEQLPVTGHFVPFPLYPKTYYALPSEVLMPFNDGQFGEAIND